MFAGQPFASAAFAQRLPIFVDAAGAGHGAGHCAIDAQLLRDAKLMADGVALASLPAGAHSHATWHAVAAGQMAAMAAYDAQTQFAAAAQASAVVRGQTIRDGSAGNPGRTTFVPHAAYWYPSAFWADGIATSAITGAAFAGGLFYADGAAVADINGGYTLPTELQARGVAGMHAYGSGLMPATWDCIGSATSSFIGYLSRDASARGDGYGTFIARTGKKIGVTLAGGGAAKFRAVGVIPGEDEGDLDAHAYAQAVFVGHYDHNIVMRAQAQAVFSAASNSLTQALTKMRGATDASLRGHAFASSYVRPAGVGTATFRSAHAAFAIADATAKGDSWTRFVTWLTLSGGASMHGTSSATFASTYAAAHIASMLATGASTARLDGAQRIFLMAAARSQGVGSVTARGASVARAAMRASGSTAMRLHQTSVRDSKAEIAGHGYLHIVPGNPIFQFLHSARDTCTRSHEPRSVERPFEQRKVDCAQ